MKQKLCYKEFITQLLIYVTITRILAKGYLAISLIIPLKIEGNPKHCKKTQTEKTNPDYDLVTKR